MNRVAVIAGILVLVAAAAAPAVAAPPAASDSAGVWTTVPLPDGTIMYVRYGPPGGVRIRSGAPAASPAGGGIAAADTAAASDSLIAVVRDILRQELRALGYPRPPVLSAEASAPSWPSEAPPIGQGAHGPITVVVPPPAKKAPAAPPAPGRTGPRAGEPAVPGAAAAESVAAPVAGMGPPESPAVPTPAVSPETPPTRPAVGVPLEGVAPDTGGVAEAQPPPGPRLIRRAFVTPGLLRTNLILFETGKAVLLPVSEEVLRTIAGVLGEYPEARIEVAGYTDSRGSAEMNLRLSRSRAEAVREFLITEGGLDPARVTARGYGESDPVASNATETGRALNRRVEFRVLNPEALDGGR